MPGPISSMVASVEIEVVYITTDELFLESIELPASTTVSEALDTVGIYTKFPELAESPPKVGIYGKVVSISQQVKDGDRIEVYRPLIFDPKEARRQRAERRSEQDSKAQSKSRRKRR